MEPQANESWANRSYRPQGILQLHVTERCNLHCAHCYQEDAQAEELALDGLLDVVAQFKELLDRWRSEAIGLPVRGHVNVTGGEPFVRADFLDLLEALAADAEHVTFSILTNGTLIDEDLARRIAVLAPRFVQVSIEGTRRTHEAIRGAGSFDRAQAALRHLAAEGVRTFISFTAYRGNFREFADVARLGCSLGVSRVWADRLVPLGSGSALTEQVLTPAETRELFDGMLKARIDAACGAFGGTEISMRRGLQFLVAGEKPYHCSAGNTLITVLPNGDVYPCRRMPIRVGNTTETCLAELYYHNETLRSLRDRTRTIEGCQGCSYADTCRGGARCLAYALTGDPFRADPGCWLARGSPAGGSAPARAPER